MKRRMEMADKARDLHDEGSASAPVSSASGSGTSPLGDTAASASAQTVEYRHRGVRRRIEAAEELRSIVSTGERSAQGPLLFNERLVHLWAKGALPSSEVQELAWRAATQGAANVDSLAELGTAGANPQNIHSALRSLLGLPRGACDFTWIELPTKAGPKTPHPVLS